MRSGAETAQGFFIACDLPVSRLPAIVHAHPIQPKIQVCQVWKVIFQQRFQSNPQLDEGLMIFIRCWVMHSSMNGRACR